MAQIVFADIYSSDSHFGARLKIKLKRIAFKSLISDECSRGMGNLSAIFSI